MNIIKKIKIKLDYWLIVHQILVLIVQMFVEMQFLKLDKNVMMEIL